MKPVRYLFILMIVMFACSDDNSGSLGLAGMSATIDGTSWETITRVTVLQDGRFVITGTSVSGKILVITINGDREGTYELGLTSAACGAVYKESATTSTEDAFVSVTGKVILTSVNSSQNKISGTFEFSLLRELTSTPMTVSDGKFDNLFYTVPEQ
jgi:hypothetical protein